jgi:hypothetical protein
VTIGEGDAGVLGAGHSVDRRQTDEMKKLADINGTVQGAGDHVIIEKGVRIDETTWSPPAGALSLDCPLAPAGRRAGCPVRRHCKTEFLFLLLPDQERTRL